MKRIQNKETIIKGGLYPGLIITKCIFGLQVDGPLTGGLLSGEGLINGSLRYILLEVKTYYVVNG